MKKTFILCLMGILAGSAANALTFVNKSEQGRSMVNFEITAITAANHYHHVVSVKKIPQEFYIRVLAYRLQQEHNPPQFIRIKAVIGSSGVFVPCGVIEVTDETNPEKVDNQTVTFTQTHGTGSCVIS